MALEVINSLKNVKSVGRALAVTQKYSPQILTAVGIAGVVTAAVLGAKATLKLEDVVDKTKEGLDDIADKKARFEEQGVEDVYSSFDERRDTVKVYLTTAKDLTKLYAIPVSLGIVSISCIVGGQGIQYKRTVASVAAYKTLEETFDRYRQRVVADLGIDKDEEYRRGYTSSEEVDADGNKSTVITGAVDLRDNVYVFDKSNPNWKSTSPDYNLMFVKAQETFATQLLNVRGHVFLNDIFDSLGMPRTREGAVLGWVLDRENNNFIDFGIKDLQSKTARLFGTDEELGDCLLLEFNVDGIVWDKI
jgi:hypothetical protein